MSFMNVLYQDEKIIAVCKPSGVVSHANEWTKEYEKPALQQARDIVGKHVYMIHRLDRPTSGILLFGKTPEAARFVKNLFDVHHIEKTYHALVRGFLSENQLIDHPVNGKQSISLLEPLCHLTLDIPVGKYAQARYTFARLKPKTGRMHQLRKHMVHLRNPIVGDTVYGDRHHNKMFKQTLGFNRLWLFATSIKLRDYYEYEKNGSKDLEIHCPITHKCRRFLMKNNTFVADSMPSQSSML